ncbi:protease modulator HflC [Candidatus Aerophobetes bacterium]|nr:protease modulator HflC [Candidatus Aerophobetes bacterium]
MKWGKWISIIIVIIIALVVLNGTLYTVDQVEQVVITQFGKPVGGPIIEPGLHIKIPFIQKVNRFDKRLLSWDGSPTQIPTKDKKYIWVDTTARWKIVDPLKFLQATRNERIALARLDDIVDSATRNQITKYILYEVVRNTGREFAIEAEMGVELPEEMGGEVKYGREKISREILKEASSSFPQYGMELVDVRIKRINYVEDVRQKVYSRMISERKRVAEQYRSEGMGEKERIEGLKEKELKRIISEAYKKAQEIEGSADAKATKIYAEAYNKDPEFYSFLKTLETYKNTLDENTWLILSSDSEFYKYLKSIPLEKTSQK